MADFSAQPLRVVFVNHVARCSGAEHSLLSLLRHLPRHQVQPYAVVPPGPLAERLEELDIPVTPIPARRLRRTLNPWSLLSQLRWLGRVRRQVQAVCRLVDADLVHANSLAVAIALARRGTPLPPLVWHCRDFCNSSSVLRWLVPKCAAVIAISKVVREHLEESCPGANNRCHLIHNGIDGDDLVLHRTPAEVREEMGVAPDQPVVISVGQLIPWKRHDVLLQAAEIVRREQPFVRFWLVGDDLFGDNQQYVARLRASAPSTLTFTGHRQDAADLIRAADLLVHTATAEPLGRVILEAMLLGTPCVAPAAGGIPELLEHGVSGWLVEPGPKQALATGLAEGVLRLLADPALRESLAQGARQRVEQHFTAAQAAAEMAALYRRVEERR